MLVTSLSSRNCIGFFGHRPRLHQLDPETDHWWYWQCWTADELIVDAFDPDVVAAYVTGSVQPAGKFHIIPYSYTGPAERIVKKGLSIRNFLEIFYHLQKCKANV